MGLDVLGTLRAGLGVDPAVGRPSGIEIRQDLTPAAGLPVQPPSYEGKLEIHLRHVDGDPEPRPVIELDSVGSSANRLEEVLLELRRAGRYPLPVSSTTVTLGEGDSVEITTLEMPHRQFDAWLRLSAAPDAPAERFERSDRGRELSLAHPGRLDALVETSAHDLLFGVWDSHRRGPHGQVRIGRSLTTSLIGLDPIEQAQFAARRDPLNLGDGSETRRGEERLSNLGLSSIPPQQRTPYAEEYVDRRRPSSKRVENFNGGVAISAARYLGFLSFAALRRLGFERYDATDVRVMLATLGLYALTLRAEAGWDLRARCALVPDGPLQLFVVGADGRRQPFTLTVEAARSLFDDAVSAAGITDRSVRLDAGDYLNGLVAKAVTDQQRTKAA